MWATLLLAWLASAPVLFRPSGTATGVVAFAAAELFSPPVEVPAEGTEKQYRQQLLHVTS